jgi:hypothetical protein
VQLNVAGLCTLLQLHSVIPQAVLNHGQLSATANSWMLLSLLNLWPSALILVGNSTLVVSDRVYV